MESETSAPYSPWWALFCPSLNICAPQVCLPRVHSWGDFIWLPCLCLRPGPHYFCSSFLSQSPNILLLTFFFFIAVILLNANYMFLLFLCLNFLSSNQGLEPLLLRVSELWLLSALVSLLFISSILASFLLSWYTNYLQFLKCLVLFHGNLCPVSAVTPPAFLVSNSHFQLLFKISEFSGYIVQEVSSDLPNYLLCFCSVIAVITTVLHLSFCLPLFSLECVECNSGLQSITLRI